MNYIFRVGQLKNMLALFHSVWMSLSSRQLRSCRPPRAGFILSPKPYPCSLPLFPSWVKKLPLVSPPLLCSCLLSSCLTSSPLVSPPLLLSPPLLRLLVSSPRLLSSCLLQAGEGRSLGRGPSRPLPDRLRHGI